MSSPSSAMAPTDTPARWEERSAQRVLETGRDQILDRSRKIVEAAYDLLADDGLEGLTIRAVLNKTGLSRRAFYERFEGKDDLVLAVFEQTIRMAAQRFSELIAKLPDPMERLKLIVTYIVLGKDMQSPAGGMQSSRRGAALSREHLRLAESRPGDLQVALRPLLALTEQQLADGMAVGAVRQDNPQRMAALLYNLVSTTVHSELLTPESTQSDQAAKVQLANDIWEFCRRAIEA
jgi:AcrR family transcriptional regulator